MHWYVQSVKYSQRDPVAESLGGRVKGKQKQAILIMCVESVEEVVVVVPPPLVYSMLLVQLGAMTWTCGTGKTVLIRKHVGVHTHPPVIKGRLTQDLEDKLVEHVVKKRKGGAMTFIKENHSLFSSHKVSTRTRGIQSKLDRARRMLRDGGWGGEEEEEPEKEAIISAHHVSVFRRCGCLTCVQSHHP